MFAPIATLGYFIIGTVAVNAILYRRRVRIRNRRLASMRRHPSYVGNN